MAKLAPHGSLLKIPQELEITGLRALRLSMTRLMTPLIASHPGEIKVDRYSIQGCAT